MKNGSDEGIIYAKNQNPLNLKPGRGLSREYLRNYTQYNKGVCVFFLILVALPINYQSTNHEPD